VVAIEGRFVSASNTTLLGTTADGEPVVYKPVAGERPLWDFERDTLARREVLTYRVSEALGLGIVPETALGDGLYGPGSVQRYVDMDETFDPLPMVRSGDERLWPMAMLDIVCNNADRKLGHILRRRDGALVAIDHGLTFHPEEKLRTVLWIFAGAPLPERLVRVLEAFIAEGADEVGRELRSELGSPEAHAFRVRVSTLMRDLRHPAPPEDRPALPWPPY
jgi:hypothetical protein